MALPDPKHYWTFDIKGASARKFTDSKSTTGAFSSTKAIPLVTGKLGRAIKLASASAFELKSSLPDLPAPWSLACWVQRTKDYDPANAAAVLVASGGDHHPKINLATYQASPANSVGLTFADQSVPGAAFSDSAFPYQTPLNSWVHLTLVCCEDADSGDFGITLYHDGQTSDDLYMEGQMNLGLGYLGACLKQTGEVNDFADMLLDDLRVYDVALTPEQVAELATGAPPAPQGLPNDFSLTIGGQVIKNGGSYDLGPCTIPTAGLKALATACNNTGNVISLSGNPFAAISQALPEFVATGLSASTIGDKQSATFNLQFMPIASNPNKPLVRSARVSIELSDSSRSPFTFTLSATVNPAQLDYDYLLACSGPNEQTAAVLRPEGIWHKEAAAASFVRYSLPAQIPQGSKAVAVQKLRSMMVFLLDNGQLWYGLDGQGYYKLSDNCWEFDSAEFRDAAAWGPSYMPKNLITISPDGHVTAQDNATTGGLDAPLVNAVMVQRQRYFSAVLTNDGHVHCWGKNDVYQCGANYAAAAITDPAAVPKVSNVGHIAITKNDGYGATFVMAATLDGKVWVWGNDMGASGVSNRDISQGPVQVGGFVPGTKIVKVYCGYSNGEAFGIDDKGNLWSWGKSNGQGTLGRNNAPGGSVAAPGLVAVPNGKKVQTVVFNGASAMFLTETGAIYWFGSIGPKFSMTPQPTQFGDYDPNVG